MYISLSIYIYIYIHIYIHMRIYIYIMFIYRERERLGGQSHSPWSCFRVCSVAIKSFFLVLRSPCVLLFCFVVVRGESNRQNESHDDPKN